MKIENWGNDGYARFCTREGHKPGDWQAWQDGFLNIVGSFESGEEQGQWGIYNVDHSLLRTVQYDQGELVKDEVTVD